MFFKLFQLKTFLKDNPQLHGSTPFWNKTGLLCHSSGCDVTLRMIRQHSELFNVSTDKFKSTCLMFIFKVSKVFAIKVI